MWSFLLNKISVLELEIARVFYKYFKAKIPPVLSS